MLIDSALLDTLSSQAKESHHLRQAYDLRTTPEDNPQKDSQRNGARDCPSHPSAQRLDRNGCGEVYSIMYYWMICHKVW